MSNPGDRDRISPLQVLGGAAAMLGILATVIWASAYKLERHNQRMIAEGVRINASVAEAWETVDRTGRWGDNYNYDLVLRWKGSGGEQLESRHRVSGEIYALAVSQANLEISYVPGRAELRPFILAEKSGPATTQGLIGLCLFMMAAACGAALVIEAFPRRRPSWPEPIR